MANTCTTIQLAAQKEKEAASPSEKKKKKAAKAAEQAVFVNKTPKGEKKGNIECMYILTSNETDKLSF